MSPFSSTLLDLQCQGPVTMSIHSCTSEPRSSWDMHGAWGFCFPLLSCSSKQSFRVFPRWITCWYSCLLLRNHWNSINATMIILLLSLMFLGVDWAELGSSSLSRMIAVSWWLWLEPSQRLPLTCPAGDLAVGWNRNWVYSLNIYMWPLHVAWAASQHGA